MSLRRFTSQLLLSLLAVGLVSAGDPATIPDVETIVQRMARARTDNQAVLRTYMVTRRYTLVGKDRQNTRAQVLVQIHFVPPNAKKFVIQKSSGTKFGERAVRQMLEHEMEIVKNHASTEMSWDNYGFRLLREELCGGRRCFILAIAPRRTEKTLLVGRIWVDAATYLLHRIEGAPAKSPSWWLRDSSVIFTYGDVDGMWLQTASESTANVRFVGRYTMLSRDAEYALSNPSESASTSLRGRQLPDGSAIWPFSSTTAR